MSVVACRFTEKEIEISADSISVQGYTQEKGRDKFSKLNQINGLTIGSVGYASENGMMQIFSSTHKPSAPTEDGILNFLAEFAEWKKKKTEKYEIANNFIIVFEGHAFVSNEFWVKEFTSYEAIGAGMDFALAALYLGHDTVKAIETACELSVFCEKPIKTFRINRS
jgi:hypothetical protein